MSFNESTPGVLHRDPIGGDSRDPVVWARSRAEGAMQVFKLLVRSCRRWQLKFCNQFNELFAARHAPPVLQPTSNPGRPPLTHPHCTPVTGCTLRAVSAAKPRFCVANP